MCPVRCGPMSQAAQVSVSLQRPYTIFEKQVILPKSSVAAIWLQTLVPTRQPRMMVAKRGLLRTSRPYKGRFSAWPMSAAFGRMRMRNLGRKTTMLL